MILYSNIPPAAAAVVNVYAIITIEGKAALAISGVWNVTDPGPPIVPGVFTPATDDVFNAEAANAATDGVPIIPLGFTVIDRNAPGISGFWDEAYRLITAYADTLPGIFNG